MTRNNWDGPWNFSDETLPDELRRALGLLRGAKDEIEELEKKISQMKKQHRDFIFHFGEGNERKEG